MFNIQGWVSQKDALPILREIWAKIKIIMFQSLSIKLLGLV